ncbi:MAG: hypothetical protein M3Z22_04810 [Verrucomicrobiota bacterium]|nr:hypothetical protein [Verrucomicrobiota bacterium]
MSSSRRLPNTTPAVLRTLATARDTFKNTPAPADQLITAAQFAQLDDADPNSLLSRFAREVNEVDLAFAAQAPLTSALSQAGAKLTMFISHFHQVLDLGITRGTFATGARRYYNRDIAATTIPPLTNYDEVQTAADAIVEGELARKNAEPAYVEMMLPRATEIDALRGPFKTLRAQSQSALANTNKQQEDVTALYPEAQALAVDLCDTIEFNLRFDKSDSSRRAKAEQWGVVYIYGDGTATAPAVTPPATPPPSP